MGDLTPLQVSAIYMMQKAINDEKEKAYADAKRGGSNKTMTIEEYRDRRAGKNLYTEQATEGQKNNWLKMKEHYQKNPPVY